MDTTNNPVTIVTSQDVANDAWRTWINALVGHSRLSPSGWTMEGSGVGFNNYGYGEYGEFEDQVMLGADVLADTGTVKIVRPIVAEADKKKLTVLARASDDRLLLLREGWLKPNKLSGDIRSNFAGLSGLDAVPLLVAGTASARNWYLIADLSLAPVEIVRMTARFASACARARSRAGGGKADAEKGRRLGRDEKGRLVEVKTRGGTKLVRALQGYVWEELRAQLGDELIKPGRAGYEVDGLLEGAGVLIEIKTGTGAADIHTAVGQLTLYPPLIGIDPAVSKALLVPDDPPLRPMMAAALEVIGMEVFTYSLSEHAGSIEVTFSKPFLRRCRAQVQRS